jgi:hypothetical protein
MLATEPHPTLVHLQSTYGELDGRTLAGAPSTDSNMGKQIQTQKAALKRQASIQLYTGNYTLFMKIFLLIKYF